MSRQEIGEIEGGNGTEVTVCECMAMRLLYTDGRSCEDVARMVGRHHMTAARHIFGECEQHIPSQEPPLKVGNIPSGFIEHDE